MKRTVLLFSILLAGITVFAQDELKARMEFDNAEQYFSESKFTEALAALDKVDTYLGQWTPKVAYLKIMAMNGLAETSIVSSITYAATIDREINKYLAWGEANPDHVVMEKYKEVYAIKDAVALREKASKEWNAIKETTSRSELESFMNQYGNTPSAKLAQRRITEINALAKEKAEEEAKRKRQEAAEEAKRKLQEAAEEAKAKGGVLINGVIWATCNVGSKGAFVSSPEKYGNYYLFGEAQNVCPVGWRVPTRRELELLNNAGSDWVTLNKTTGRNFGNGNDKIFLPAAGGRAGKKYNQGSRGTYWSSEFHEASPGLFTFTSDKVDTRNSAQNVEYGGSVRCVAKK